MPAEPRIRPATRDDGAFLGWTIFAAARGHLPRGWFDIILEKPEDYCLDFCTRLVLAKAVSWWHWSLFRVAEMDGRPVGAACGFADDAPYRESAAAMREAADGIRMPGSERSQLWPRGSFIMATVTGEDGAWTVENVAVLPGYRGRGVTGALLDASCDDARQAGARRAQISFLIGNAPAERAYTRAGFVFSEEKRDPGFEAAMKSPGTKRFTRDL
ncbi:MAG TPA: GNAT family N-acetyltransferase [Rhizomicrobium sp.]|nr:GNAT family N-acetyltransferase [Rhizomicrobium sp.]